MCVLVYYRVDLNSLGTAPIQICEILSDLLFNAHLELVILCPPPPPPPPPHTHTPHCAAWDNLRIDVSGFKLLCKDFLSRYPGYYIVPLRVSGSAVETLFAQYKYLSGNKLDSVNYTTARAKYMCNKAVAASHHSGKYYRDMPLFIPTMQLKKKQYGPAKQT